MLWIKNPARLKTEVAEMEALRDRELWLLSVKPFLLKNLNFAVEFAIAIDGEASPFILEYPAFFPNTPPKVTPQDDNRRLSDHQYGPGGELCLEYRADNWDPSITGAMMVESTYRLLAGEQPRPEGRAEVPSAHHSTLGQRLRGKALKFLLTKGLQSYAASLQPGACCPCRMAEIRGPRKNWTAFVLATGAVDSPEWREETIPAFAKMNDPALLVCVDSIQALEITTPEQLSAFIAMLPEEAFVTEYRNAHAAYTVIADRRSASLYYSFTDKEGERVILPYLTVDLTSDTGSRLPEEYGPLRDKKVGIVGGGSLGSKIGTSLARSGVGSFVLVDDDILTPGNLVRHDLDVEGLGSHKVDALERRLKRLSPFVSVHARRVVLGGQESAATTDTVLDRLAECDLLIDATADPQAFNFVAAVARSILRPIIWAEVYAGGIGGFVARLRPNVEPAPHLARQQYLAWCEQHGVPWAGDDRRYENRAGDAPPLIADDADVALIAAHAARMAIDVLVRPEASRFPHPAYLIGLSEVWIFKEPMDVRPIDFLAEGQWREEVDERAASEALNYIIGLLQGQKGSDDSESGAGA